MNPNLARLRPYPFERLGALLAPLTANPARQRVALSLGEPKHPPPEFVIEALASSARVRASVGVYPPTRGGDEVRAAIAAWILRRFGVTVDPERETLPVNGTREALFSFAQAVLSGASGARVLMPNPFYQIYEGAALLRGATPYYVPDTPAGEPDFDSVPEEVWRQVELAYICNPANPSGGVVSAATQAALLRRAHEHGFVVAADECYSEIYRDEAHPPQGLLQVATEAGYGLSRCVVFNSLSKRSNLPGLRSGFAAGGAALIAAYLRYRTYHGCAMPAHVAAASALAWADEEHVVANRAAYRAKFDAAQPLLAETMDVAMPAGAFFLWPRVPGGCRGDGVTPGEAFAARLFERENVVVLPGAYLAREQGGVNPGADRVRLALVAPQEECVAAVRRVAEFAASAVALTA